MANVSFFKTCEKRPDILAAVSKANVMRTDMRFAWKQVDFQMIISPGLAPEPFSEPAKNHVFYAGNRVLINRRELPFDFSRRLFHPLMQGKRHE